MVFFFFMQENPFRRRVCEVFGESPDGALTFEQFLEMFSVFSESSPRDVKATYAFRVYGKCRVVIGSVG